MVGIRLFPFGAFRPIFRGETVSFREGILAMIWEFTMVLDYSQDTLACVLFFSFVFTVPSKKKTASCQKNPGTRTKWAVLRRYLRRSLRKFVSRDHENTTKPCSKTHRIHATGKSTDMDVVSLNSKLVGKHTIHWSYGNIEMNETCWNHPVLLDYLWYVHWYHICSSASAEQKLMHSQTIKPYLYV